MNKNELISAVAEKTEYEKKVVEKVLNGITESIGEALAGGEDTVNITNFGSFKTSIFEARDMPSPQNPKQILHIEECLKISFKAGKGLKDVVNERDEKATKKKTSKKKAVKKVTEKKPVTKKSTYEDDEDDEDFVAPKRTKKRRR